MAIVTLWQLLTPTVGVNSLGLTCMLVSGLLTSGNNNTIVVELSGTTTKNPGQSEPMLVQEYK